MALKKLLTKLEKGSQLQGEAMQEAFPSHFQFNANIDVNCLVTDKFFRFPY